MLRVVFTHAHWRVTVSLGQMRRARTAGGVDVFYWDALHFQFGSFHLHGPNVVRFQLYSGGIRWFIVGCCLAPDYSSIINRVISDIGQIPRGAILLVGGGFNCQVEEIMVTIITTGLEDMPVHFFPRFKY